jgi:hypothetical protein
MVSGSWCWRFSFEATNVLMSIPGIGTAQLLMSFPVGISSVGSWCWRFSFKATNVLMSTPSMEMAQLLMSFLVWDKLS